MFCSVLKFFKKCSLQFQDSKPRYSYRCNASLECVPDMLHWNLSQGIIPATLYSALFPLQVCSLKCDLYDVWQFNALKKGIAIDCNIKYDANCEYFVFLPAKFLFWLLCSSVRTPNQIFVFYNQKFSIEL